MKLYTEDEQLEIYQKASDQLCKFLEDGQGKVPITHHYGIPPANMYKFQYTINNSSFCITVSSYGLIEVGNNLSFSIPEGLTLYELCEKMHAEHKKIKDEFEISLKMNKISEVFGISIDE